MALFNKNKEVLEKVNDLTTQIQLLSHDWESQNETRRKSEVLASNVAAGVMGNSVMSNLLKDDYFNTALDSTTFNKIQKMEIPTYMSWDFWVKINQWAAYWTYRYEDFEHEHKRAILKAIKIAVLYGYGGIDKKTWLPLYVTPLSNGKWVGYPQAFSSSFIASISDEKQLVVNKDSIKNEYTTEDLYIFQWRDTGIGDYVWCLKPLLTDIYLSKILECNTSQIQNKQFYKAKNIKTFPTELSINLNPFSNFGVEITDEGIDSIGNSNKLISTMGTKEPPFISEIILACKYQKEQYYQEYGRQITSSKNQSLSADANLSVSACELIAKEHDYYILDTLKQMGIEVELEEPDQDPENENADKEGNGIAKTNGDTVAEKGGK